MSFDPRRPASRSAQPPRRSRGAWPYRLRRSLRDLRPKLTGSPGPNAAAFSHKAQAVPGAFPERLCLTLLSGAVLIVVLLALSLVFLLLLVGPLIHLLAG